MFDERVLGVGKLRCKCGAVDKVLMLRVVDKRSTARGVIDKRKVKAKVKVKEECKEVSAYKLAPLSLNHAMTVVLRSRARRPLNTVARRVLVGVLNVLG